MTALTNIQKRIEAARKMKQDLSSKMGSTKKTTKLDDGLSRWRILPAWTGNLEDPIMHSFGVHFVKDVNGGDQAIHLCLEKTYNRRCPICSSLSSGIRESTSDEAQKALSESKSTMRILVNAIRTDAKGDGQVVILELPTSCWQQVDDLIDKYLNDAEDPIDMTDLDEGLDIEINRTGKMLTTKYAVLPVRKTSKVAVAISDLFNLDEYVNQEHPETELRALKNISTITSKTSKAGSSKASVNLDDDILEGEFDDEIPFIKETPKAITKADDFDIDVSDLDFDDL